MAKHPFALQLYTVRDHMAVNPGETLKQVKKIGYDAVELAGLAGLSPTEFKKRLNEAGLKAISAHVGYEEVASNPGAVIEMAATLGLKYVAVAKIDPALTPDRGGWIKCANVLDAGGAQMRKAGLKLCYHNHAHEFQWLEGQLPLDILFDHAAPENLAAQLDLFWIQYAGSNPVDILQRYSGRCPLVHVKEMLDMKSRAFAEMGEGILKWDLIFKAAEQAGVEWYIVEQDACARDSIDSARISAGFMAQH